MKSTDKYLVKFYYKPLSKEIPNSSMTSSYKKLQIKRTGQETERNYRSLDKRASNIREIHDILKDFVFLKQLR